LDLQFSIFFGAIMRVLLILLLPVVALAQVTFGPLRLDDSLDVSYFYPVMNPWPTGDLLCTWASSSDARIATYGQHVGYDGGLIGPRHEYQNVVPGTGGVVCPAKLIVLPHADASQSQLIFHS
jgi:hypothetical protein